jgi:hypothetical protein
MTILNINSSKNLNNYPVKSKNFSNLQLTKEPQKLYGNFSSANPELAMYLPNVTSPGWIDSANCTGLDYVNTNPDYSKLTFQQCDNKFTDQYFIPENGFAALLKNLNYTFDALSDESKKNYINQLKLFIKNNSSENKIVSFAPSPQIIEKFTNEKIVNQDDSNNTDNTNNILTCCNIIVLIIMIIIIVLLLSNFTKK